MSFHIAGQLGHMGRHILLRRTFVYIGILARVDSAGAGFIISEPGFCCEVLCCQRSSLLCFGLFGGPVLEVIGSTV